MEHGLYSVVIEKDKVVVICHCGWSSQPKNSEEGARKDLDSHLKAEEK